MSLYSDGDALMSALNRANAVQLDPVEVARQIVAEADPAGQLPSCRMRSVRIGSYEWSAVTAAVSELLISPASGSRPTVAVLMDRTPIRRHGEEIKPAIEAALSEAFDVRRIVLDDGHPELHASETVIQQATEAVTGATAVVSIGGGTITDIGKVASAAAGGMPLVVVQTAASVDGFTDDVSVLLRNGVKRTTPSRWPDIVLADVDTVDQAPLAMNVAGFGELNSMFTAPADWLLAALIGVDTSYHLAPLRVLDEVGSDVADWSADLGRSPEATARLTRALAIRGIATGISGGTACLSGVEHLVSHMLDLSNGAAHRPIGLHGAQVGAASIVAAAAWQLVFDRLQTADRTSLSDQLATSALAADENSVRRAFDEVDPSGGVAGECWSDYAKKAGALEKHRAALRGLIDDWPSVSSRLRPLVRTPDELAHGLVAAGAIARLTDLDWVTGNEHAVWAVTNCAFMRNRLTVIDLLVALGWWTSTDIAEVLAMAELAVTEAETSHAPR
jgi:glycerol-1-phosphate dehydrogenase [NAD(P)+]